MMVRSKDMHHCSLVTAAPAFCIRAANGESGSVERNAAILF